MQPNELIQYITFPDWKRNSLSAKQHALYTSNAKRQIVCGGRYSGKDHCQTLRTIRLAHELYFKNREDAPHEGCVVEVAILGPSADNFEFVWKKYLREIPKYGGVAANGKPNYRVLEKTKKIYLFGDGICFNFITLHGGGSNKLGAGYDILHITEAAFITEKTLRDVVIPLCIRPTFAGYVQLNSTPDTDWYNSAVQQAKDNTGYYANYDVHCLTSFDNPKLEADQLEEILAERDTNYQRFRKRYCGELFIEVPSDLGSNAADGDGIRHVFLPEWVERCLVTEAQEPKPPFRIGIDIGWSAKGDALAVVILDANNYIVDIECKWGNDISSIVAHLERLNRDWKNPIISYDAQGKADILAGHVQGRGLRIKGIKTQTNELKVKRVEYVAQLIKAGKIKIPHPDKFNFGGNGRRKRNFQQLRKELMEFVAEHKQTAMTHYWFYGKPQGGTDDIVDALIYAATTSTAATSVDKLSNLNLCGV